VRREVGEHQAFGAEATEIVGIRIADYPTSVKVRISCNRVTKS
jgi:hypothetical protein